MVLFRAATSSDAIRQAEREARQYARYRYTNAYGQRVSTRYLGAYDCFEPFEPPGPGQDVYSATTVVSKRLSDRHVVGARLGRETKRQYASRMNVFNRDFVKPREEA